MSTIRVLRPNGLRELHVDVGDGRGWRSLVRSNGSLAAWALYLSGKYPQNEPQAGAEFGFGRRVTPPLSGK